MESASQRQALQEHEGVPEHEADWATLLAEGRAEWNNPAPGRVKRFARWFYNRFVRLHGSPEQIAWGTALGLFLAMSPTMGLQMAIAIPLAAFFKISKLAAAGAVWLTNPATAPFIYWFNFKLGAKILGYPLKAGFLADLAILNQNPFEVDEHQIRETRAALTIVDGKIVYSDGSLHSIN